MKKRAIIPTLTIIALLTISLSLINFTSADQNSPVQVTRLITKNQAEDTTTVRLGIVSSENVLAIKETFIPADCAIIDTHSEPEIDIFEVNENEQTWVMANRSDTINIDMYYTLPYNCDVDKTAGEVFVLTDDDQLTSGTMGGEDGTISDSTAGGNTAGGNTAGGNTAGGNTAGGNTAGSGTTDGNSDSTTEGLQSTPIIQTETQEEFDKTVANSLSNILGIDTSKDLDTKSLIMWIVLGGITLLVIIGLIFSLMGKSKQKFATTPQAPTHP